MYYVLCSGCKCVRLLHTVWPRNELFDNYVSANPRLGL